MKETDRPLITKIISDTLIKTRLAGKIWASEVVLDYGHAHPMRVDFMSFEPQGQFSVSDIEKGSFTCYEVKSCMADVRSGHGLNFLGERNYIVTTMECYKQLLASPESLPGGARPKADFGYMVLIPDGREEYEEFEAPSPVTADRSYHLSVLLPCRSGRRSRSLSELLFCMLRAKHK